MRSSDAVSPNALSRFLESLEAAARVVSEQNRQSRSAARGQAKQARLAAAVSKLSSVYTREREHIERVPKDPQSLAARLQFFLPRDAPKYWFPLREVWDRGWFRTSGTLRILDLGAGVGASCLGATAFLRLHQPKLRIHIEAIDRWPVGLAALEQVLRELASTDETFDQRFVSLATSQSDLNQALFSPVRDENRFDIILFGLSLNEGGTDDQARRRAIDSIGAAMRRLRPGGFIVVLEPALRVVSRWLQSLRDDLEQSSWCQVYAPCPPVRCCPLLTMPKDWCHQSVPSPLPPQTAEIAKLAKLRFERLTFSYLTLVHPSSPTLRQFPHAGSSDGVFRVVSDPLASKGKRELVLCGPAGKVVAMRLDRDKSELNTGFELARRGDFVLLSQAAPAHDTAPATPAKLEEIIPVAPGVRFRVQKHHRFAIA